MCGLLTNADYQKYGHQLLDLVSSESDPANALSCDMLGDGSTCHCSRPRRRPGWSSPTAPAATPQAQGVRLHLGAGGQPGRHGRRELARRLGPLLGGSQGVHLEARRGSLVTITLRWFTGKKPADPKQALPGLATRWSWSGYRTLGKTDTGSTHKVKFEVLGTGKATSVSYGDPNKTEVVDLKNVTLPWSVEVPFAVVYAKDYVPLTLTGTSNDYTHSLSCRITVDGRGRAEQLGDAGVLHVQCTLAGA